MTITSILAERLPSIPYPPPSPPGYGYWEPVTSTIDWCEENYYATRYSAEVINTFTNLLFMYLAVKGMYNCIKHGHDRIFIVTFAGYLLVGSGSFAFHATLKYPWQLVDELSMIYTTCLMFWTTFEHRRSLAFKIALGIFVLGLAVFITLYYHFLEDPTFHQVAYGVLTAIVLSRSMILMELSLRPYFQGRRRAEQEMNGNGHVKTRGMEEEEKRRDERDRRILKQMWLLVLFGHVFFLGGFAIWNLDNIYCGKIRGWRREIGLPWGLLLEGHGWWHIGTGLGAYFFIVWGIWLRHCLNGRQDEFECVWPSMFTSIPRIERRKELQHGSVEGKKRI